MALLIQPDFSSGELALSLYGRVDTNEYRKGLKTARNVFCHAYGGVSNRSGTIFAGWCKDHDNPPRLIPFRFKNTDTYMIEMGNLYMRFMRNGYHIVETVQDITDITEADPAVVTCAAHGYSNGDEVFIGGLSGMTELNGGRFIVASVATDTFELTHQVTGDDIDATGYAAYVSGGKVARIYTLVTTYAQADLDEIKFVQSGDIITLVHPDYDVKELRRTGHTSWSLVGPTFEPDIAAPATVTVTPTGTPGSTSYTYRITTIKDVTFTESEWTAGTTATGNATLSATDFNALSWSAVVGAFRYNIYKLENGLYGYLGTSEGTIFNDTGAIAPNFNTTPPNVNNPFNGADNQPGAVGFYEQRKVYGNTNNAPDTKFYSVIGDYDNFATSFPSQADDAITAVLNQQQVNEIRHFVALSNGLLVFTSGAEWRVSAGSDAGFSVDTLRQLPQSSWGSSHLAPLIIGDKILFVQELSSAVRSFGYTFESDIWKGADLTLLARHLFLERKLTSWGYAPIPDSLLHAVRDDGILLVLTFAPDQQVIAWTHWDTRGSYKDTANIPNVAAAEDVTYFVVQRKINGSTVCSIERQHTRRFGDIRDHFFVDAGLTLDGPHPITGVAVDADGEITITAVAHGFLDGEEVDLSDITWVYEVDEFGNQTQPQQLNNGRFTVSDKATDTFKLKDEDGVYVDGSDFLGYIGGGFARCCVDKIYGAHHLAGEEVTMLGDGNVYHNLTVALDGTLDLEHKVSRAHVGLPYISDVELLDVEAPSGTIQGVTKLIPGATIRFERSRGLLIGPDAFHLTEMKQRELELLGMPGDWLTGDKHIAFNTSWNTHGRVFMRQVDPLPMSITAVIPDIVISPPRA